MHKPHQKAPKNVCPSSTKHIFSGAEASASSLSRHLKQWTGSFPFPLTPWMERRSTQSTRLQSQNRRPTRRRRFLLEESVRKPRRMRSRRTSTNLVSSPILVFAVVMRLVCNLFGKFGEFLCVGDLTGWRAVLSHLERFNFGRDTP